MRPYKIHKIDLSADYPCPCRRRGNLKPIMLTEALGCQRCQQIFVIKENGQVIEQLSSIYHKKAWRWTGHRWINAYSAWRKNSLSLILVAIAAIATIGVIILPLILQWLTARSIIFWTIVLLILIVLMLSISYRH